MKSIALYIHIPFCKQKCFYCDFPSYASKERYMERYIDALIIELKNKTKNKKIKSIFIGGGTPSYLRIDLLDKFLNEIQNINKVKNYEFSIECNPGTLSLDKLKVMKKYGVNRLSFGLQAVQNESLKKIGRIHTFEEFKSNLINARECGFNNINIDLMFGLPNQTIEDWIETLEKVCQLQPEHISAYSLIIEEDTPFYQMKEKGLLHLPNEDEEREMYILTKKILGEYNYNQYEISNYSKDGYQCEHNKCYWKCEEYIGIGSSASSYIDNKRITNIKDVESYINKVDNGKNYIQDEYKNTIKDNIEEFVFMGLRLIKGIDKEEFKKRFKEEIYSIYGEVIEKNKKDGLIVENKNKIFLSEKGIELSNFVMSDFILDK